MIEKYLRRQKIRLIISGENTYRPVVIIHDLLTLSQLIARFLSD